MSINITKTAIDPNPLDLDTVKNWIKQDGSDDDTLITAMMDQVLDLVEYWLNISISRKTITIKTSPVLKLVLPYGIIQSIESVEDLDGAEITYIYDGINTITVMSETAIEVVYTAGWDVGNIPTGLIMGLQEVITNLYENRGDVQIAHLIKTNANLQAYNKQSWFK